MTAENEIVIAQDDDALSAALGCSSATVDSLHELGVLEFQGELWEVGPARDYLRDIAWAGHLWQ